MAGRNTVEIILSASDRASRTVRSAFGDIESSSSKAMGAIKAGAAIAGAALAALGGYVAKVGVEYNAMMEQSEIAWSTILGSQEKAKETLKELQRLGAKTPYEFEGLDKSAKLLNMAGFEGENLFKTLTNVGDAVAAIGGNDEVLQGVSMALFQMSSKGKVSAEEMNQMAERGIPAWQMLADGMHKTVPELMKLSQQGKLFAKDAIPLMVDAMGKKFGGAMDKQSKTFNGMMSTMRDNLKILAAELSKPIFDKLKKGLEVVLPILDKFSAGLKDGGLRGAFAAIFPNSVMNVIDSFAKGLGIVKEGIGGVMAVLGGNKGGGISMLSRIGLGPEAISIVVGVVSKIRGALLTLKGAFSILTGDSIGGITFLTKMGFSPETITKVVQVVNGIRDTISNFFQTYVTLAKFQLQNFIGIFKGAWDAIKGLFSGDNALGQSFMKIFNTAKSIVMPLLSEIIGFVKDKIAMIKQFWDENGEQIIEAVKKAWAVIAAVFKFIAPVILGILRMLWDAIAGIIDGAIKIIMGIIKVFAGLFTGDFSKMWEGIKQIFFGAIEAVWNYLNLLMFGRIIGGIKSFVTSGVTHFTGFWTKTVEVFKNLDTYLWQIIVNIGSKIGGFLKGFVDEGIRIFGTLRTFGASLFESLWTAIRTVAMNMASGVKNFFLDMVNGAKFHMDGLVSKAQSIFNAVKTAITNPIETAKTTVGKAIEAIKGFFSNMTSKIKMPHFSIMWSSASAFGKTIKYPTGFDVEWYDKGGVFYGPQVIGVGEKRPEFVGALDDLRRIVREESSSGHQYSITLNYSGTGSENDAYSMLDIIERELFYRYGLTLRLSGVK